MKKISKKIRKLEKRIADLETKVQSQQGVLEKTIKYPIYEYDVNLGRMGQVLIIGNS